MVEAASSDSKLFLGEFMRLNALSRHWDNLAKEDPMWAILSDPNKKGGKWDPGEFFDSGFSEVVSVMEHVKQVQPSLRYKRALDFGCGLGRLTQALATHFDEVIGVDIAPEMIKGAERYNSLGDRCKYILNPHPDLSVFDANHFDFIYSNLVLQHMHPRYSAVYLRDFIRVLAPGGVALFQIPSRMIVTVKGLLMRIAPRSVLRMRYKMDMFCVPKDQVMAIVTSAGARIRLVQPDNSSGALWESYRYTAVK